MPLYENGLAPLNKMAARSKKGKKKTKKKTKQKKKTKKKNFNLGQRPDFKIISQKCSLGDPLQKLLKWFRSAEQNDRHS